MRDLGEALWAGARGWIAPILMFALLGAVFVGAQALGGETVDEWTHFMGLRVQVDFAAAVLKGAPDLDFRDLMWDLEYYGVLPMIPAAVVRVAAKALFGLSDTQAWEWFRFTLHACAMASGVGAALLTFHIAKLLSGARMAGWIAAGLLMAYPVWLGQSFFNYKDLPLAFFFTLSVYGALTAYSRADTQFRRGLLYFAIGAFGACGVKFAGAALLAAPTVLMVWSASMLGAPRARWTLLMVAGAAVAVAIFLITPPAWRDPVDYVIASVDYMARHAWGGCTQTAGACLGPQSANWSALGYIATWGGATLPAIALALMAPVAVIVLFEGHARERWLLAMITAPVALMIWRNSTLYDGLRHLLFAAPGLFALTVTVALRVSGGLDKKGVAGRRTSMGLKAAFAATFALFLADDVALYPYNYAYFNEIARAQASHRTFETDYWGFSFREAGQKAVDALGGPQACANLKFDGRDARIISPFVCGGIEPVDPSTLAAGTPYVFIAWARGGVSEREGCTPLTLVERRLVFGGAPLVMSYALRCTAPGVPDA